MDWRLSEKAFWFTLNTCPTFPSFFSASSATPRAWVWWRFRAAERKSPCNRRKGPETLAVKLTQREGLAEEWLRAWFTCSNFFALSLFCCKLLFWQNKKSEYSFDGISREEGEKLRDQKALRHSTGKLFFFKPPQAGWRWKVERKVWSGFSHRRTLAYTEYPEYRGLLKQEHLNRIQERRRWRK